MGVDGRGAVGLPDDETLTDTAWLARAAALMAEAADDHETARAAAAEALALRLTAIAAALCAAAPDSPLADRDASAVVRRLATAAPSRTGGPDPSRIVRPSAGQVSAGQVSAGQVSEREARALADDFTEALGGASVAVFFCRCTQHPGGRCWFSAAGPADGLCGDVLALAHRLRPRANAG